MPHDLNFNWYRLADEVLLKEMLLPAKATASLIEPSEFVVTWVMLAPLGMVTTSTGTLAPSTAAGRLGAVAPSSEKNEIVPEQPVAAPLTLAGTTF